jgi:hypothetical protein
MVASDPAVHRMMDDMSSTLPPSHTAQAESDLLQLSVHSLPAPVEGDTQRTRVGRWKMLLVMAVCAAPVIASYMMYYVVRPQARVNYGDLIDPVRPLPADAALPLTAPDGHAVSAASLKGQWLLVTVAGGDCDQRCEHQLYMQRQIRESLGKDKDRVDRVWLINDGRPMKASLKSAMRGATVLSVDGQALARWLVPEPGHELADHWFLVDPRGQWMMRFEARAEPRKVQKDLIRLLKAAASWDEAGRP